MLAFLAKTILPTAGGLFAEELYIRPTLPALYSASSLLPFLPRAYAGVILVNGVGSAFTMITLGFKVAAARKKFIEKAKKDGDEDAEARYSYPKMYAEGFSENAKKFNCVQRGHQHALETYTTFLVLSLIGGIKYPIVSIAGGLLWHVSRFVWAEGYATGDPQNRYANFFGFGVWTSLLIQLSAAVGTAVSIAF